MRTGPGPKADGGGCAAGARPEGRRQRVCTGPGPKADGGGCPRPHVSRPTTTRARRARPAHSRRSRMSTPRGPSAPRREAWTQTGRFATIHVPTSRQLRVRRKSVDKIGPAPRAAGRPRHVPATPVPEPSHSDASRLTTARTGDPGQPTHRPRTSTPRGPHSPRREAWTQAGRFATIHVPTSQTAPRPAEKRRQKSARRPTSGGPPRHAPPAQDPRRPRTPAGPGPPRPRTRRQAQDPREARNLPQARRRPGSTGPPLPGAQPLCGATDHPG